MKYKTIVVSPLNVKDHDNSHYLPDWLTTQNYKFIINNLHKLNLNELIFKELFQNELAYISVDFTYLKSLTFKEAKILSMISNIIE